LTGYDIIRYMPRGEKSSSIRNITSATNTKQAAVKSITRAASVLICLSNGTNTVTGIAHDCHLSKSTVHRLLRALEESNLAIRDTINHRYYLGNLITQLASNPQTTHEYLINSAMEEMKYLADYTEETVALGIMLGIQYVRLHEIPSKHSLKVTDDISKLGPPFLGSTVKVLLSQLNDEKLKIAMKNFQLGRIAEHLDVDINSLMGQLKQIQEQGYAISFGERIAGALGVSVPIGNYVCPASLSIVGPESRLKAKATGLAEKLKTSASHISRNIAEIFSKGDEL
jgi:IclR family transcriptional regulator, KDG regulon repressor